MTDNAFLGVSDVRHRRDHRTTGRAQPRRAGADERRHGPSRPGRQRDVDVRRRMPAAGARCWLTGGSQSSTSPRRCPAHGGPGDRARVDLQRRDLQLRRPAAAPGGRGADVPVHRRHGCHAARARPARAGCGELAARHVHLRLLGPEAAPAAAGQGSPGHQAALPRTVVRSERGLVGGLRLRASCPAGLRAAGHASARPAGRGQRCVERLRGRPGYRRQRRRAPLAGPAARVRWHRQGGPPGGLLAHPRRARPIRPWTRKAWPPSWRRG